MKAKCISQCQTDRKVLYEVGKTYDIDEKIYESNKDRFEKIGGEKQKNEGQR